MATDAHYTLNEYGVPCVYATSIQVVHKLYVGAPCMVSCHTHSDLQKTLLSFP